MSETNEHSSTAEILDMLSTDCEWAADVLVERWAGLRSDNQTQRKHIAELKAENKDLRKAQDILVREAEAAIDLAYKKLAAVIEFGPEVLESSDD